MKMDEPEPLSADVECDGSQCNSPETANHDTDSNGEETFSGHRRQHETSDNVNCVSDVNVSNNSEPSTNLVQGKWSESKLNDSGDPCEISKTFDHCILCEELKTALDTKEDEVRGIASENRRLQASLNETGDLLVKFKASIQEKDRDVLEMSQRLEKTLRAYDLAKKDKESMVMKYAIGETEVANKAKTISMLERKLCSCEKELNTLNEKFKNSQLEKTKLRQLMEAKDKEVVHHRKEADKQRMNNLTFSNKIKGLELQLNKEIENNKEAQSKVGIATQRLKDAKEESEKYRKEMQELIRQCKTEEEKIISERNQEIQENDDQKEVFEDRLKELHYLKKFQLDTVEELNTLRDQVKAAHQELHSCNTELSAYKELHSTLTAEKQTLQSQVAAFHLVNKELEDEKSKSAEVENQLLNVKIAMQDFEDRISGYSVKEHDNLQYIEKLTGSLTAAQFELSETTNQLSTCRGSLQETQEKLRDVEQHFTNTEKTLEVERGINQNVTEKLSSELETAKLRISTLLNELEEEQNMNIINKRKQDMIVKDLKYQVQQLRKKTSSPKRSPESDDADKLGFELISMKSRSSSSESLKTLPVPSTDGTEVEIAQPLETNRSSNTGTVWVDRYPELDKNMLVDKMVRMQKQQNKYRERVEFLEDHVSRLTTELNKKRRVIKYYISREETGSLPSLSNSSIQQSSFLSNVFPPNMSKADRFGPEFHAQLQSVLEDTILKNIKLQEAVDYMASQLQSNNPQKSESNTAILESSVVSQH